MTCINCFNVWVPLGFGTSSCSCIGNIKIRSLWLHDRSWGMWMMIRGCLSSNHHYRACFLLRKFFKPMIASYVDPAHFFLFRCANSFNWYQSGCISDTIVISNTCCRIQKSVGRIGLDDHVYFVYICLTLFCRCLKIQSFFDSILCPI